MITADDAFRQGMAIFNDRCKAEGVEILSPKDLPIIAAHAAFLRGYENTAARITADQHERFDREAPVWAAKLIATAVLA